MSDARLGRARLRLFVRGDPTTPVTSTWADLFARANRYDRTEADVTDALAHHRDGE
jgi:hypothetical protein